MYIVSTIFPSKGFGPIADLKNVEFWRRIDQPLFNFCWAWVIKKAGFNYCRSYCKYLIMIGYLRTIGQLYCTPLIPTGAQWAMVEQALSRHLAQPLLAAHSWGLLVYRNLGLTVLISTCETVTFLGSKIIKLESIYRVQCTLKTNYFSSSITDTCLSIVVKWVYLSKPPGS